MTEAEVHLLRELADATDRAPHSARPMDLGGTGHSNTSNRLKRMCDKGWVERNFGLGWNAPKRNVERGSCRYRITAKGRQALANRDALAEIVRRGKLQPIDVRKLREGISRAEAEGKS